MALKALPIDMISAPNYYSPITDGMWVLTSPNAQVLWLALQIVDSLGTRSYTPAVGATLTVTFQRSDLISTDPRGALVNTIQNVVKNGTFNTLQRSLVSISLTSLDVKMALSGSVKFDLTESGQTQTWVQNWMVKKLLTDPGY